MQTLVELYGMDVEEGHLPRPRTNEIALSRTVVTNRGLQVGDSVGHPIEEIDSGIPTEMVVVGILSLASGTSTDGRRTDRLKGSRGYTPWLGFASYEYLRSHELYASRPVNLLVVSKENQKAELDTWLEGRLSSEQTEVRTYATALRDHRQANQILLGVFALVEGVLIVVAPITLAILSYTFFLQRREEFGILHAMGQSRRWLVLRTAGETASAVLVAWLVAAVIFVAGLVYIQGAVYGPKGLPLDFMNPTPWLFTIPLPLTVIAVSTGLVARVLSKLDPVSVIERR
jgi:ABC-type antimicrobial peptide transport system permease subunit